MTAMGLKEPAYVVNNPPVYYLSMKACGKLDGAVPMQCGQFAQTFDMDESGILEVYGSRKMCGMIKQIGAGTVCAVTGDYPSHMGFWGRIFEELNIHAGLSAKYYRQGIYFAQTEAADRQKLLYLINLDCVDKTIDVEVGGRVLFENFVLKDKKSLILPVEVKTPGAVVLKSTAEITEVEEDSITFRTSQPEDTIYLETRRQVLPGNGYVAEPQKECTVIRTVKDAPKEICVRFE